MKKICQYCKTEFETSKNAQRYCSPECKAMFLRRARFREEEKRAARLGVSLEDLHRIRKARKRNPAKKKDAPLVKWLKRPKTYAQIKAANRKRRLVSGWRGQPVIGGGAVLHNDPPLTVREIERKGSDEHSSRYDPDYHRRWYLRRKAQQAKANI